jgi:hypothetical protein
MKKLLLVLAIGAFVACNNSGTTETTKDSTTITPDTTVVVPDTTVHQMDTTAKPDSTKK